MEILIVTGMSGAGKTKCLKHLEDLGWFCVDNIMPELLPDIISAAERHKEEAAVAKLAVSADVRGGIFFHGIFSALDDLTHRGLRFRVLFLDATDEVLVSRYKETRREHPLSIGGRASEGIRKEREMLEPLKNKADIYLDTSHLSLEDFRQRIYNALPGVTRATPSVIVMSFGFKRGIPMDCDMVYDARFLPNPFHIPELRAFNGTQKAVADYVYADGEAQKFVEGVASQIESILPRYLASVKPCLIVGIGCTGGKHRSVATAEHLAHLLQEKGYPVRAEHRDLFKE